MEKYLIGPFTQIVTMANLPIKGALSDDQLEIIKEGGLIISNGKIQQVGLFNDLRIVANTENIPIQFIEGKNVCLPAFVDCHTHIAFGGNRANDFAYRNAGKTYLDIAAAGGGIANTVSHTRALTEQELVDIIVDRSAYLIAQGISTIEVKSGYGLNVAEELKLLRSIQKANQITPANLVATCLAAHILPKDFKGNAEAYLNTIIEELFPIIKKEKLTNRIDAFIEKSAFSPSEIAPYFNKAREIGFDITVHADQFTTGGSDVAIAFDAVSADHLEASTEKEINILAHSDTVAVALPAASLGVGCAFTPARKLLDAGASLAVATDWNPGTAPMAQLVTSASILATMEKLTNAEVLAAITFRAANALRLKDRGILMNGLKADFIVYDADNYQNITYLQGCLQPQSVWINGQLKYAKN
ncbi:imidazolonepropionase [Rhizosphaericola mali]|uniref:Imidazolonepropionase n=1 Tax=Rhizosphaericola mali TaxID=2545455 RepID=A0A5P2G5L8_9BACT|nr:imidazolonepropionase [Rhizosphaericola mali]QES89112.1 imidazolonepropionase [Rhizosphaericola mali]